MTDEKRPGDSSEPADSPGEEAGQGTIVLSDGRAAFEAQLLGGGDSQAETPGAAPTQLGTTRYVHAAFFAAAVLVAFVGSKVSTGLWNWLSDIPLAVEYVPQLVRYDDEVRDNVGLVAGAIIGLVTILRVYRKQNVRAWADAVAGELAKVTWPDRNAVANGTVVVVVASLIATVYVTILDKFWGFTTGLIYAP